MFSVLLGLLLLVSPSPSPSPSPAPGRICDRSGRPSTPAPASGSRCAGRGETSGIRLSRTAARVTDVPPGCGFCPDDLRRVPRSSAAPAGVHIQKVGSGARPRLAPIRVPKRVHHPATMVRPRRTSPSSPRGLPAGSSWQPRSTALRTDRREGARPGHPSGDRAGRRVRCHAWRFAHRPRPGTAGGDAAPPSTVTNSEPNHRRTHPPFPHLFLARGLSSPGALVLGGLVGTAATGLEQVVLPRRFGVRWKAVVSARVEVLRHRVSLANSSRAPRRRRRWQPLQLAIVPAPRLAPNRRAAALPNRPSPRAAAGLRRRHRWGSCARAPEGRRRARSRCGPPRRSGPASPWGPARP